MTILEGDDGAYIIMWISFCSGSLHDSSIILNVTTCPWLCYPAAGASGMVTPQGGKAERPTCPEASNTLQGKSKSDIS